MENFAAMEGEAGMALHDGDGCDFCVSESLRAHAESICRAQGMSLPTGQVLFLYDETAYKGGPKSFVARLPRMMKDTLYQATGRMFHLAVCLRERATEQVCEAQISQEIYHCLRHLRLNARTREVEFEPRHEVEQWREQVEFATADGYADECANLFDVRIYPDEEEGGDGNDGAEAAFGAAQAPEVR